MSVVAPIATAKTAVPKVKAAYEILADTLKPLKSARKIEMHVRRTIEAGKLDAVLRCVQKPQRSNITFKMPSVFKQSMYGVRLYPEKDQWSQESVLMALRRTRAISEMLDHDVFGFGKNLVADDPRQSPSLLGTYLELLAVDIGVSRKDKLMKGEEQKTRVENLRAAADRLLSILQEKPELKTTTWEVPEFGQVTPVLENLPVFNGLVLAQKILGAKMPQKELANEIVASYGAGLQSVIDQLKAKELKEDSYAAGAVKAWENRRTLE